MKEVEKHTVLVNKRTEYGNAIYTRIINKYDPQLMFDNTPRSNDHNTFQTACLKNGVFTVYSFSEYMSDKEMQILALSGGTKKEKERIVHDFNEMLNLNAEGKEWVHVSRPIVSQDDVYTWIIHLE